MKPLPTEKQSLSILFEAICAQLNTWGDCRTLIYTDFKAKMTAAQREKLFAKILPMLSIRNDLVSFFSSDTRHFIEDNRDEIIADIIGFLRSPITELKRYSRWGDWDRDILSRLPDPSETQAVLHERRAAVDCDTEESTVIEDFFRGRLQRLGYDVQTDRVFIPVATAAKWLGLALNDRHITTTKASQSIRQKIDDGSLKQLSICRTRQHGRGFEFWGADSTGQTYLHNDIEHRIETRGDN